MPGFKKLRQQLQFRHFRTRILVFVLSLLMALQIAVFFAVNTANIRNAIDQIHQALVLTRGICEDALNLRRVQLLDKARLLSGDYAFKATFATGDVDTLQSALDNHRVRVRADVMMLLDFDDARVISDTSGVLGAGTDFPFPDLLDQAFQHERGESSGLYVLAEKPFQFVLVPLFTPEPSAWIVTGFEVGDAFAEQLKDATQTEVSILESAPEMGDQTGQRATLFASTLAPDLRGALEQHWNLASTDAEGKTEPTSTIELGDEPFVSLTLSIGNAPSGQIIALLQRPLNAALASYLEVRKTFALVFLIALILSIIAVVKIAKSVTRPVNALVQSAREIENGDYTNPVRINQRDELGTLADSFNQMMKGLAERRQVRSLLGKVVSPEIADELLKKDIELGGEERSISILFSDVRNFTSMCEGRSPSEILNLLNRYFTRVSEVVEKHNGVIDKYIGDAVMALFGAPIKRQGDEQHAVLAALEMCSALDDINVEFRKNNQPELAVGVGINTDVVVVGNMGSSSRLNYTAIGDGVNLASRLEGLTKQYGVDVIVSENTKKLCPDLSFRALDKVRVKGKNEPVNIYEALGPSEQLSPSLREELARYDLALLAYLGRNWQEADAAFEKLQQAYGDRKLYQVYRERIVVYLQTPPPEDWDGSFVFTSK